MSASGPIPWICRAEPPSPPKKAQTPIAVCAKLSSDDQSQSDLTWPLRLQLALRSYVELVLDFALLYALFPGGSWKPEAGPALFTELISYSATTITTSGAGTLVAVDPALQLLSVYEIFCGVILLVVSFTIYTSRGLGGVPIDPRLPPAAGQD